MVGDYLVVIGIPKVGQEVIDDECEILNVEEMWSLINNDCVNEIIPAGSKGLLHEINQLELYNNSTVVFNDNIKIDLTKSAGPATCAILTVSENKIETMKILTKLPFEIIGKVN